MSPATRIPRRFLGEIRMPCETGPDPRYYPGECITRPMTPEERIKYGLDKQKEDKPKETEVSNVVIKTEEIKSMPKLTKELLAKLLDSGMDIEQIGKEYYPEKPSMVKALAVRLGLINAPVKKKHKKIVDSKPEYDKFNQAVIELNDIIQRLTLRVEDLEKQYSPPKYQSIITEVINELERGNRLYGLFNSPHEGYAVIKEEVEELWNEVKKDDYTQARKEAIQIAAMAIKFVACFD